MGLALGCALYFICWWLSLFLVLPFAGRRQNETDTIVEGSAASAPENPKLLRIFLITTLIATCVFAVVYLIVAEKIITLDDIPFFPKFDKI